jgi:rRNA maturation endonuclease Nob1
VALQLGGEAATPVSSECSDMCGLTSILARFGIGLVLAVWLVVTVVAAVLWTWATRVRCPHCRKVVEPPVRFCPNCGYDLLKDVEPTSAEPPSER